MLKDYRLAPTSGQSPDSVVVFLHGYGDCGSGGLLEIGRVWQQALPNTEFICPDAPFALDNAPPFFEGRQWFPLQQFTQQEVETGILNAAPILDEYINHILASRKIEPDRLVLVGFSQGTMMALHVALRREKSVAAVIGYSGLLAFISQLATEKKCTPPVLLVHGTADEVVPFASMAVAERALKAAGFSVQSQPCLHLNHGVDELGIETGMRFILQHLSV